MSSNKRRDLNKPLQETLEATPEAEANPDGVKEKASRRDKFERRGRRR